MPVTQYPEFDLKLSGKNPKTRITRHYAVASSKQGWVNFMLLIGARPCAKSMRDEWNPCCLSTMKKFDMKEIYWIASCCNQLNFKSSRFMTWIASRFYLWRNLCLFSFFFKHAFLCLRLLNFGEKPFKLSRFNAYVCKSRKRRQKN